MTVTEIVSMGFGLVLGIAVSMLIDWMMER